jgi:Xaa-Pro aminopeptidase
VLIDAGCEVEGYASDITRTFPVNGRFSGAQRDAYEIVLAAQHAAIDAIKPGAPFIAYHDAALRVLVQGMIDLKLLTGSVDGSSKAKPTSPSTCTAPATGSGSTCTTPANTNPATTGSRWSPAWR